MLQGGSNAQNFAEINPSDTDYSILHAVSIDESDVSMGYYAIGKKDGGSWYFYVVKIDWDGFSAQIK